MSWVRLHDGAMTHPKVVGLSDKAFRLWIWGLTYCQMHLTDGFIPAAALMVPSRVATVLVLKRLWDARDDGGWMVHDYLDWNDSKDVVTTIRQLAKARMVLVRDPSMRSALRQRDQDHCRYCGIEVNWADRKSAAGATYDHITPGGGDTLENLVIACRGCNSRKAKRTPEQAGLTLLQPFGLSKYVSGFKAPDPALICNGLGRVGLKKAFTEKEFEGKPSDVSAEDTIEMRGGRLVEHYGELYIKHRLGAKHHVRPNLDWHDAMSLCRLWDDARLEKLAVLVLTTDDDWITKTDRSFKIFALKATWADDKLKAWEAKHRITG